MPALRSKREVGRRRRRRRRRGGGTEEADRQPASVQPAPPSAGPIAGCCGHGRLRASQRPEESPDERPTARSVPRRTVFAQLRATPPGERRRGPSAGTGGRPTDRPTDRPTNYPGEAKPTLSQTWTVDEPASAMCVQSVDAHMSCSSHSDAQFAAFFIDPRAK